MRTCLPTGGGCVRGHTARVHTLADGLNTAHSRFIYCGSFRKLATNRPDIVENVVVSDPMSDHCRVTADLRLPTPNSKRTILYRPDYELRDWPTLRSRLKSLSLLESIYGTQNIEAAWQLSHNLVWTCIANNVPLRTITIRGHRKKMGDAFRQALPQKTTPLPRSLPITKSRRLGSLQKT